MTYLPGIPLPTDNLSFSQGQLKDNFTQLNDQFGIDHTAYNTGVGNGDGFHKQIHLPEFTNPTVTSGTATQGSVIYSAAGTAAPTKANLNFKNDLNLLFPLSIIKAYALIDGNTTGPTIVNSQGVNVGAITVTIIPGVVPQYIYTVNLTANTVATADYAVINLNGGTVSTRTTSSFLITFIGPAPTQFAIVVLQL
jgi:hypothetical protein